MKARTQAANQLGAIVLTAPEPLRTSLRGFTVPRLVDVVARFRPGPLVSPEAAAKLALRHLARRHIALSARRSPSSIATWTRWWRRRPRRFLHCRELGPTSPERSSSRRGTTRGVSRARLLSPGSAVWLRCRPPSHLAPARTPSRWPCARRARRSARSTCPCAPPSNGNSVRRPEEPPLEESELCRRGNSAGCLWLLRHAKRRARGTSNRRRRQGDLVTLPLSWGQGGRPGHAG